MDISLRSGINVSHDFSVSVGRTQEEGEKIGYDQDKYRE